MSEVAVGHDADEDSILVHHRQIPNIEVLHKPVGKFHFGLRRDRNDVNGHAVRCSHGAVLTKQTIVEVKQQPLNISLLSEIMFRRLARPLINRLSV